MVTSLACIAPACRADAPAFDRPGLAFAAAVLPLGSFDWEQGLPDVARDRDAGVRTTLVSADTELRFGIGHGLELQVAQAPFNRVSVSGDGEHFHDTGAGDARVGVKWAPTVDGVSLAVLGAVTFDTGVAAFTNGANVYSLGVSASRDVGDGRSVGLYANVDHSSGHNVLSESASYGFPLSGTTGGFVELGHSAGGGPAASVAGGGVTWLLRERLQLDVSAHRGLTSRSPDLGAGFGVSYFWD